MQYQIRPSPTQSNSMSSALVTSGPATGSSHFTPSPSPATQLPPHQNQQNQQQYQLQQQQQQQLSPSTPSAPAALAVPAAVPHVKYTFVKLGNEKFFASTNTNRAYYLREFFTDGHKDGWAIHVPSSMQLCYEVHLNQSQSAESLVFLSHLGGNTPATIEHTLFIVEPRKKSILESVAEFFCSFILCQSISMTSSSSSASLARMDNGYRGEAMSTNGGVGVGRVSSAHTLAGDYDENGDEYKQVKGRKIIRRAKTTTSVPQRNFSGLEFTPVPTNSSNQMVSTNIGNIVDGDATLRGGTGGIARSQAAYYPPPVHIRYTVFPFSQEVSYGTGAGTGNIAPATDVQQAQRMDSGHDQRYDHPHQQQQQQQQLQPQQGRARQVSFGSLMSATFPAPGITATSASATVTNTTGSGLTPTSQEKPSFSSAATAVSNNNISNNIASAPASPSDTAAKALAALSYATQLYQQQQQQQQKYHRQPHSRSASGGSGGGGGGSGGYCDIESGRPSMSAAPRASRSTSGTTPAFGYHFAWEGRVYAWRATLSLRLPPMRIPRWTCVDIESGAVIATYTGSTVRIYGAGLSQLLEPLLLLALVVVDTMYDEYCKGSSLFGHSY
ncbi:hypothetical protein GQ42DRAFT_9946 [Ramicandelaber brevisporus]|nr:hypothetical protein GQ42DRAFT_9946 [Ramicandelaber brevisporus]